MEKERKGKKEKKITDQTLKTEWKTKRKEKEKTHLQPK